MGSSKKREEPKRPGPQLYHEATQSGHMTARGRRSVGLPETLDDSKQRPIWDIQPAVSYHERKPSGYKGIADRVSASTLVACPGGITPIEQSKRKSINYLSAFIRRY